MDGNIFVDNKTQTKDFIKLGSVFPDANLAWRNDFRWRDVYKRQGLYSAGYTGSEILYISVVRRRKFWREKIGGNGKKYYL